MTHAVLFRTVAASAMLAASVSGAKAQLEITIGGSVNFCTGYSDLDYPGDDDFGDFSSESEIVVGYRGVADNGLEYGAKVDIIGDNGGGFGADNFNPCPTDKIDLGLGWRDFGGFDVRDLTFGIEKTFLDGRASIELRLPHFSDPIDSYFGDLSIIGKYAFRERPNSVISAGLELTLPTAEFSDETALEPFVSWAWVPGTNVVIQGHHSVTFITNEDFDPVISTDLAASYVVGLNAGWLKAIVPQVGLHYNWPTNLPGGGSELNLSLGSHFMFDRGLSATLAVGFPLGGLEPYDKRVTAGLQWNFGAPPPPPPP